MKKQKVIKLALIKMLSDSNTIIEDIQINNEIETLETSGDYPQQWFNRKLSGRSSYKITIFRNFRNDNTTS
jgi:hypothetical protein